MLDKNNVSIKSFKVFIEYLIVFLLEQKINLLKLTIVEKELCVISML